MQIEDIVKSVQAMSTEEIEARIREIRHSRTQSKEVSSKPAGRPTKKADKTSDDVLDLFKMLSPDERASLIASLGGE